jgi:hypothetical protein
VGRQHNHKREAAKETVAVIPVCNARYPSFLWCEDVSKVLGPRDVLHGKKTGCLILANEIFPHLDMTSSFCSSAIGPIHTRAIVIEDGSGATRREKDIVKRSVVHR